MLNLTIQLPNDDAHLPPDSWYIDQVFGYTSSQESDKAEINNLRLLYHEFIITKNAFGKKWEFTNVFWKDRIRQLTIRTFAIAIYTHKFNKQVYI